MIFCYKLQLTVVLKYCSQRVALRMKITDDIHNTSDQSHSVQIKYELSRERHSNYNTHRCRDAKLRSEL